MKRSDIAWVETLARVACGKSKRTSDTVQLVMDSMHLFLEESTALVNEYVALFNEHVRADFPDSMVRVFRLGTNRPGVMLLRGRDKLVLSGEPGRIRVRLVQVHAYGEKSCDALDFAAQFDSAHEVVWQSVSDGQRVNPELLVRYYLSPFLVSGTAAYAGLESRSESTQQPTL